MRKILIDTHVLIWWLGNPEKLRQEHLNIISNPENDIFVSIASFYEITLKVRKGKLEFKEDFENILLNNYFEELPITIKHLNKLKTIEIKHKDPFDILLVSQALSENLEFLTYDSLLKENDLKIKWVK